MSEKSTILCDKTLFGGAKLCSSIRKAKLFHYANSRARPQALGTFSITTMGIVFHERRMENYFSLTRNRPRTSPPPPKLRIPHAVAILATARSRPSGPILPPRSGRKPTLHSRRSPSRNSRLRARGPLSECINFSPFVLGSPSPLPLPHPLLTPPPTNAPPPPRMQ